jgi:hypothetical protein
MHDESNPRRRPAGVNEIARAVWFGTRRSNSSCSHQASFAIIRSGGQQFSELFSGQGGLSMLPEIRSGARTLFLRMFRWPSPSRPVARIPTFFATADEGQPPFGTVLAKLAGGVKSEKFENTSSKILFCALGIVAGQRPFPAPAPQHIGTRSRIPSLFASSSSLPARSLGPTRRIWRQTEPH